MIEAHALTKRYGPITAVDQLSFDVRPGVVTGFLGPNGSGKSTTMRNAIPLTWPASSASRACPRRKPTTAGSWPCCVTSAPDRVGSWRG